MLMVIGLLSGEARAADDVEVRQEAGEVDRESGRRIRYRERTEIDEQDFDILDIEGKLLGPEVELMSERQPDRFNPLIRLRRDWRAEMLQSLDEVR